MRLERQFTAFRDMRMPIDELRIYRGLDDRSAAARWHMIATFTGPLEPEGFAPTEQPADVTGVCMYEVHDGLIRRHELTST